MKISVVGANGSIARLMHPLLRENGHTVRGLIRKDEQAETMREMGVDPVVCDVEYQDDISDAIGEADAVVFAAGAGPGSGAERKWSVDRDGAIKLIEAAKNNKISRYIMISAMGLDEPRGNDVFQVYQKAKAEADEALRESGLNYTIIKPGRLTDEPGTGLINMAPSLEGGEISRKDVASVLVHVLEAPGLFKKTFDVVSGDTPIDEAIKKLL